MKLTRVYVHNTRRVVALLVSRCHSNRSRVVQLFHRHQCNYTGGFDRSLPFSVFVITSGDRVVLARSTESSAFREIGSPVGKKFSETFIAADETNSWTSNCCLTREYGNNKRKPD